MTTSALAGLPDIIAKAERLPSPPAVAMELLTLTASESVSIPEMVACLSRDPVLTTKLLKLANSTFFRRAAEVTTIERATMLLGLKTVRLMALSFSLVGAVDRKGTVNGFDYGAYWRSSMVNAVTARSLARLVRNQLFDEAFLCGLLARFGQLAMAQCIPDQYRPVCERAPDGLPTAEIERAMLGFDHHEVTAALLEAWKLPRVIPHTVRFADDPAAAPTGDDAAQNDLPYIMNLAAYATTVVCASRKGSALRELSARGHARFSLTQSEIDAFVISLENGVAETATLFDIPVAAESHADILEQARVQMVTLSVETAIDLEQTTHRAETLERERRTLEEKAHTDPLTGIPNRAFFETTLDEVISRRVGGELGDALGLIIMDVDRFKTVNDTHGHPVGDEVLKMVARCVRDTTRARGDITARYGGEEFVLILSETTPSGLVQVAERIRTTVQSCTLPVTTGRLSVTISLGGACCAAVKNRADAQALLKIADQCLYEAKRTGRNKSICRDVRRLNL